ncbi:HNH endonuclease signature motif containing protein [Brevibacterium renqingii]|uniref:HNH endonuclease signature motif containing protein n=1 Tax=Brevibacterium renqingii TaxID=2776916 RepID=UPI001AE084C4|nr:HNH endonuclease signature motif containing protein [Brevibacterium renqingii]
MKGTTTRSAPPRAGKPGATKPSPRYAIRFESSMTRFAEVATASDRAHFAVLESAAGVVLEQIFLNLEFSVPEGSEPFRCETIAGTLARRDGEAEGDIEARRSGTDRQAASDRPAGSGRTVSQTAETTSSSLVPYDEEFARAQKKEAAESARRLLPEFPEFDPHTCFATWVYDNVESEDLVEISTALGTNTPRTYRQLSAAMTILYGLPRFADRVRRGQFTQAHIDVVSQLCRNLAFQHLPDVDSFLATKRADITCETLRRALQKMISLLVPPTDLTEIATKRRRVDVEGSKDGSACLIVSGPSAEIYSCYNRIRAMAHAVHGKNTTTFNLPSGMELNDDRTIDQLQYDLLIRPVPELSVKVLSVDPITGIRTTHEAPLLDADGEMVPGVDSDAGLEDFAETVARKSTSSGSAGGSPTSSGSPRVAPTSPGTPPVAPTSPGGMPRQHPADVEQSDDCAAGSAFRPDSEDNLGPVEYWVKLRMPTSQWWLSQQAATVATVPFLTLTGDSELPGTLADGSPIPAEVARTIAGRSKTIQRILTDPATGTPIDAKATSYPVPKDLRKTLVEQWNNCTVPGCQRTAEKSEMDHVIPFFHLDPLKGGLTRFGNLHPLCKKHHALKTAGRLGVTMPDSWQLDYDFRHGISTTVSPPDQPINIAQALEFAALADMRPERWRLPEQMAPPPPMVLELMPGESLIRQRDEAKRLAEEREARNRRLSQALQDQRAARQRRMVQRSLDWENAVFQPCLPPGSDASSMKQLTGNRYFAEFTERMRRKSRNKTGISASAKSAARDLSTDSSTTVTGTSDKPTTADREGGAREGDNSRSRRGVGSGANDPWDARYTGNQVNWDRDLEVDPPPF